MGVVFKARQTDLDRIVAIKMILSSHLASEEQVRRFQAEAKAAARLQHPHIIGVYEFGQAHGQHYFAMQYVNGASLAQVLQRGPLPVEEAVRLVAAVARAVDHLHAYGIVHRDLKPSNILLDEKGHPYVTDFGLVKLLETEGHLTSTGAVVGTPSYMAPEQASGRPGMVGPCSDVYSLGAILYELLTGRPPFREATALDTLLQVMEGEPTLPRQVNPRIPHELELICLKCLEKAAEDRYPSAAALAEDLEHSLKGEEVAARPHGPWQRLRRWARREPALASRLGAVAVCGLVVEVTYRLRHHMELSLHLLVMAILGLLALAAVGFQRLLRHERWSDVGRFAWAAGDVILLTVVLQITDGLTGPLVVLYPLYIAATGLWFRVSLVWFATLVSVLAYAALLLDAYRRGVTLVLDDLHRHIILMVALVVLGFVVAYQVQRVRALSRYYDRNRR
jgi:serine/threonine-protein kinase